MNIDGQSMYGALTPERLKKLMEDYGIASYYELERMTGVPRSKISLHMRGQRPLGAVLRRRLAKIFTRAHDRRDIFDFGCEK
jgi:hypothetical protein